MPYKRQKNVQLVPGRPLGPRGVITTRLSPKEQIPVEITGGGSKN